jgi:GTP pyrophosphokinase
MSWIRQIIEMHQEATDPEEFLENLKIELFQDEIFVFTPKGDLHQFPKGATPIDFAFNIHTDIGMHCLTAKVNGQVVALSTRLSSGDTVEIVTSPQQSPSRSWLDSVQTVKARQSIRRWLKDEQHTHSVRLGKELLDRELKHFPDSTVKYDLKKVAKDLGLLNTEHLYAALGSGDLSVGRLIGRLTPQRPKQSKSRKQDKRGIRIQGINDLMMMFGKCCTPIPGDPIIGLITRGRGVTVHRTDCPNIGQISEDPERILQVNWDVENDQAFTVQLRVRSYDRKFLLSDISKALGDCGCNIQSATTRTLGQVAEQDFWVDVVNITHLQQAMKKADEIEGVLEVLRIDEQSDEQSHTLNY